MKNSKKYIEIEHRSRFNKAKFKKLESFLNKKAESLGKDDKDVFFYIMPDKLLKAVNNVSKKQAELVLKLNKIGQGSHFEEIRVAFDQKQFGEAVKLLNNLNIAPHVMQSFQKRHNYLYKGVELALKWSEHWGHHLELEIVVDDMAKKGNAEKKIKEVAEELGVKLMTDKELKAFVDKLEAKDKKLKQKK